MNNIRKEWFSVRSYFYSFVIEASSLAWFVKGCCSKLSRYDRFRIVHLQFQQNLTVKGEIELSRYIDPFYRVHERKIDSIPAVCAVGDMVSVTTWAIKTINSFNSSTNKPEYLLIFTAINEQMPVDNSYKDDLSRNTKFECAIVYPALAGTKRTKENRPDRGSDRFVDGVKD